MFPNEKHEFSGGWRAAQKGGPAGCTTGQASGLHIKLGCRKRRAGGLPFTAGRPVRPFVPFCAPRRPALLSSVQPAENSRFSFGNTALQPARPAGPPISVIRFGLVACAIRKKGQFVMQSAYCSQRIGYSWPMLHVWYAIVFRFNSHLGNFPFVFFTTFHTVECLLRC